MSLNTDPDVIKRIVFDFTHQELLTPTLVYVWNAETDELEHLADEIIGRMSPDFIGRYVREDITDFQNELFLISDSCLVVAFRELCSITQEEYLQFKKKWEADIAFHKRKLQTIDTAENSYYVNAVYLLEICSNAATLFRYSEPAEKRELIGMICQNLFWDGKKLTFNLLKPFDTIYQHASSSLWQGYVESNHDLRFWRPLY